MNLFSISCLVSFILCSTLCYELRDVHLNSEENALLHHTKKYEMVQNKQLILRRGFPFKIKIHLAEPFSITDSINAVASLLNQVTEKFIISVPWTCQVTSIMGNTFDLSIWIPPNEGVGKWTVTIKSVNPDPMPLSFQVVVYVIYNPWSENDIVYYKNKEYLKEYVLNDMGYVYIGSAREKYIKPWYYAQFLESTFKAIMYVMDRYELPMSVRENPVALTRAFSALVNSNDDYGILVGNWSGNYKPHINPMDWMGSVEILERYRKSNGYPVMYGQCWVYACVLTTMCRGLGIPSRPVTNYDSAHDKDKNIALDRMLTKDPTGKYIEACAELTWNFHVWTEVWMDRKDFPGYGGWQAIDGTPQENASGIFRIGPASVKAIKEGLIDQNYELPYVFAEVNADFVDWLADYEKGTRKIFGVSFNRIGESVLTKTAVRKNVDYEDLTDNYKHREGTPQERTIFNEALKRIGLDANLYAKVEGRELTYTLNVKSKVCSRKTEHGSCEEPLIGENMVVTLFFTSEHIPLSVTVSVKIEAVYYTGDSANIVQEEPNVQVDLKSSAAQEHKIYLDGSAYVPLLVEFQVLEISIVSQSSFIQIGWLDASRTIHFRKPKLEMLVPNKIQNFKKFKLTLRFKNPMTMKLTNCQLRFTGQGLNSTTYVPLKKDVKPLQERTLIFEITPRGLGSRRLISLLRCEQLRDVYGTVMMNVV